MILTLVLLALAVLSRATYHWGFDISKSGFVLDDPKQSGWSSSVGDYDGPVGGTESNSAPNNYSGPYLLPYEDDVYGEPEYAGGNEGMSLSLSGTVHYHFKWASTNSGPPPSQVILRVSCQATRVTSDPSGGSSGSSPDDGLGDAAVSFGPGQKPAHELDNNSGYYNSYINTHWYGVESCGVHCVVVDVQPDGTFEYDISPSVSESDGSADVCLALFVTVYDVKLNVAGTMSDSSGNLSCLVGQQQTASVGAPGADIRAKSWTVPGKGVFSKVLSTPPQANPNFPDPQPDGSATTYMDDHEYDAPRGGLQLSNTQDAVFYNGLKDTETITCTADVYDADGKTKVGTVTVKRDVIVAPPNYGFDITVLGVDNTSIIAQDPDDASAQRLYSKIVRYDYNVATPTSPVNFVPDANDPGKAAICQLVSDDRVRQPSTVPHPHTGTTGYWLDNTFPYPGTLYAAKVGALSGSNFGPPVPPGQIQTAPSDVPSEPLDPSWTSVTIKNTYWATLVYRAPGQFSEFVPVSPIVWTWNATATNSQGKWTANGSTVKTGKKESALNFATWTSVSINGAIHDKTP